MPLDDTRRAVDGHAALIMVAFCMVMGMQQVAIKAVVNDVSPILQIALRSGVAAPIIWGFNRLVSREQWLPGIGARSGLLAGALFAAEYLLMGEGLRWTSAAHMAVFLYTAPIFSAVVLHIKLPEERLTLVQWVGIALAFLGIAITFLVPALLGGESASSDAPHWLWGDLLGLCAGFSWGMTIVAIRTTRLNVAPPSQTLFWQLVYAFVFLLIASALFGQLGFRGTVLAWTSLGFQTFIVCFAAMLTWFWLLRHYLAAKLGVLLFMTPLFGVAFGVTLLSEPLSAAFVVGSVLVIAGLLVVNHQVWLPARHRQSAMRDVRR